jgi:hypothetical protein
MAAPVLTCHVTECVHNLKMECHAPNIAVGGAEHAMCDTFSKGMPGSETVQNIANVSGCSIRSCKFNSSMSCDAPGITVDWHADHADCDTFLPMD